MQTLLVALIVLGCSLHALWRLLPAAARRGLARALLRGRWPAPLARWLAHAAAAPSGCSGCGRSTRTTAPAGVQPIRLHRRAADQPRPRAAAAQGSD